MQEEVTQKTIAFSIKSAKVTAQVLQAAARKFLEARNKGKTKLHHGQQSLKQLKKHGRPCPISRSPTLTLDCLSPVPRNTAWTSRCGKTPLPSPRTTS